MAGGRGGFDRQGDWLALPAPPAGTRDPDPRGIWNGNPALPAAQRGTTFSVPVFENLRLGVHVYISTRIPEPEGAPETSQGVGGGWRGPMERWLPQKPFPQKQWLPPFSFLSFSLSVLSPGALAWPVPGEALPS